MFCAVSIRWVQFDYDNIQICYFVLFSRGGVIGAIKGPKCGLQGHLQHYGCWLIAVGSFPGHCEVKFYAGVIKALSCINIDAVVRL